MLPYLYRASNFTLYTYPLVWGLASGLAYFYLLQLASSTQTKSNIRSFYWLVFLAGWAGAKIAYLLFSSGEYFDFYLTSSSFWLGGGYVFWGGPLLAGPIAYLLELIFPTRYLGITSHLVKPLLLAHGVGRIGCFLAGCCYGIFWGEVQIPVQLFESLGLFAMLWLFIKGYLGRHDGVAEYLIYYGLWRTILEFYRADTIRGHIGENFSYAQVISVIAVVIGSLKLTVKFRQTRPQ